MAAADPQLPATQAVPAGAKAAPASSEAAPLLALLDQDLLIYRKLVLFVAGEAELKGEARQAALAAGHQLHHDRREVVRRLGLALTSLTADVPARRDAVMALLLDRLEKGPDLLELDRLAFRDSLRAVDHRLALDPTLGSAELQARIKADLAEVDRVEALVDAEYRAVAGTPGAPGQGGERVRWQAYVNQLRKLLPAPAPAPAPPPAAPSGPAHFGEISGRGLPDKVLVLTFDDGPHRIYTEQIKEILQRTHTPAVFFELGNNLGSIDASGAVRLGPLTRITTDLVQGGFVIGNHSFDHALLSKETGRPLDLEIGETDQMLRLIPGAHSQLFRFPYGGRTKVQLEALASYHLRSVLWNIDSMDWADPVPSSVADRVLKEVASEKRGIILFHDIHDRAGKVLPGLLERLRAEGYQFKGVDAQGELIP